jgi:hypothetical protein
MKTPMLLVLFTTASVALGQDTTKTTKTLFSMLPFRGAHVDWGGASVPYLDRSKAGAAALEGRISLPLRRFPDWSVAFAATSVTTTDTTSYVVPGSATPTAAGFHPRLSSDAASFEVERRWNQDRVLHGIAAAGVGTITNSYTYYHYVDGVDERHEDEKTAVTFAMLSGGFELNIARWLRASLVVGYRSGGRMKIPQAKGSNGGLTSAFNLKLGKF